MKKIKAVFLTCAGAIIMGLGVAFLRIANMGTDPFSCMNIGFSRIFGVSYGTAQLCVNILLFVLMLVFLRKSIGIGTLINMIAVGYSADLFMFLLSMADITPDTLDGNILASLIVIPPAIVIFCFGVALYMECSAGVSPYDALGLIIERLSKEKVSFRAARIITDILCFAAGFLMGGTYGAATIITAASAGPIIHFFRSKLSGDKQKT